MATQQSEHDATLAAESRGAIQSEATVNSRTELTNRGLIIRGIRRSVPVSPSSPLQVSLSTFFGPLNRIDRLRNTSKQVRIRGTTRPLLLPNICAYCTATFCLFLSLLVFFFRRKKTNKKCFALLSAARCSHVSHPRLEYW